MFNKVSLSVCQCVEVYTARQHSLLRRALRCTVWPSVCPSHVTTVSK